MSTKNHTIEIVRAFSAFYVMVLHVMIMTISWSNDLVLPNPKIAVDFFIVISGFLMMQAFYRDQDRPQIQNKIGAFYINRFFRIAPMYYFALFVSVVGAKFFVNGYTIIQSLDPIMWKPDSIYLASKADFSIQNIFYHVTFIFGVLPKASLSTLLPDWSIGLEMQFYLLFPLIFLFFKSSRAAANALIVVVAAHWINEKVVVDMLFRELSFITAKLHIFVVGMLLYLAIHRAENRLTKYQYLIICIGIGMYQSQIYLFQLKNWNYWILPMFVLLFYGMSKLDSQPGKLPFRANKLITFMSDTSYSVYLLHGFFISTCGYFFFRNPDFLQHGRIGKLAIILPIVAICTYLSAFICQRLIEVPGIALGRKISKIISSSPQGKRQQKAAADSAITSRAM